MIGEYPVTASLARQKDLLSSISVHIVTPFDRTIELEQQRMKDTCSLADIDFEFVWIPRALLETTTGESPPI